MAFSFPVRIENPEVLYAIGSVVRLGTSDLEELKRTALANPRHRARLCTHESPGDALHEMFIVHGREAYVRPHRHLRRREGLFVLEGTAESIVFTESGDVADVLALGGEVSYQRMNAPFFHMLLIRSELLVFHESTTGPFDPSESEFAPWSPPESDPTGVARFLDRVERGIQQFRAGRNAV
jgi:cupin fold WbuC family metalloprotein